MRRKKCFVFFNEKGKKVDLRDIEKCINCNAYVKRYLAKCLRNQ